MKKKALKSLLVFVLVIALSFSFSGCGSDSPAKDAGENPGAEKITLRVANIQPEGDSVTKGIAEFKRLVEEKSNGRVELQLYNGGSLGSDRATTESVQGGTIDMASCSSSNMTTYVKEFNALELPFVTKPENDAKFFAELDNGELGSFMMEKFGEVNLQPIMYNSMSYRGYLTVPDVKITNAAGFNNVKLRTTDSPVEIALTKKLGAMPMPVAAGEMYSAMQQGTVHGFSAGVSYAANNKFYEVLKNGLKSEHNFTLHILVMNKEKYDALPEDIRKIIDESAQEAVNYERQLANEDCEKAWQTMKDNGMTITEMTPEDKKVFEEKCMEIYDEFLADESVKKAFDLIRATQA